FAYVETRAVLPLSSSVYSRLLHNDTAATAIYTLSLHDALPIYLGISVFKVFGIKSFLCELVVTFLFVSPGKKWTGENINRNTRIDRKSTRLNSSHVKISYAVFCLKKKKETEHMKHTLPPVTTNA